jgi:hypothetical protein
VDPILRARVEALLGSAIVGSRRAQGGYTAAERWVVALASGDSVFVKAAVDARTAEWLRVEQCVYSGVGPALFMPRMVAWLDTEWPVLVLEDLSRALWPPPWTAALVGRVLETIGLVARCAVPDGVPRLADEKDTVFSGWRTVAGAPGPFLSLGMCSAGWLARWLPALVAAEERAEVDGGAFLHMDVRSDNLCFSGDRTLLVDWNLGMVGNPRMELIGWMPSLLAEAPELARGLCTREDAPLAVVTAGHFAARAGLPPSSPTSRARVSQLWQLKTALPWACELLGIAAPA